MLFLGEGRVQARGGVSLPPRQAQRARRSAVRAEHQGQVLRTQRPSGRKDNEAGSVAPHARAAGGSKYHYSVRGKPS